MGATASLACAIQGRCVPRSRKSAPGGVHRHGFGGAAFSAGAGEASDAPVSGGERRCGVSRDLRWPRLAHHTAGVHALTLQFLIHLFTRTSSPAHRDSAFHAPLQSFDGAGFSPSGRTLTAGVRRDKPTCRPSEKQFRKSFIHSLRTPDAGSFPAVAPSATARSGPASALRLPHFVPRRTAWVHSNGGGSGVRRGGAS